MFSYSQSRVLSSCGSPWLEWLSFPWFTGFCFLPPYEHWPLLVGGDGRGVFFCVFPLFIGFGFLPPYEPWPLLVGAGVGRIFA